MVQALFVCFRQFCVALFGLTSWAEQTTEFTAPSQDTTLPKKRGKILYYHLLPPHRGVIEQSKLGVLLDVTLSLPIKAL